VPRSSTAQPQIGVQLPGDNAVDRSGNSRLAGNAQNWARGCTHWATRGRIRSDTDRHPHRLASRSHHTRHVRSRADPVRSSASCVWARESGRALRSARARRQQQRGHISPSPASGHAALAHLPAQRGMRRARPAGPAHGRRQHGQPLIQARAASSSAPRKPAAPSPFLLDAKRRPSQSSAEQQLVINRYQAHGRDGPANGVQIAAGSPKQVEPIRQARRCGRR